MAQDSLWMMAVSLLWAFDIEKAFDEKGTPIEVTTEYTFGVVRYENRAPAESMRC